jgi:hypothetical protein
MSEQQPGESARALNLYQKLAKVMADVGSVEKTGHNAFHKYAFIEQGVLMAKLRPLLAEAGIVILPEITSVQYRKEGTVAQCAMAFTLVNADNPEERIGPLAWAAEGEDKGDKAVNKAGTSGHKYFLLKLFLVSDKDDPDAETTTEAPLRGHSSGNGNGKSEDRGTVMHTAAGGLATQTKRAAPTQSSHGATRGPDGKELREVARAFKGEIEAAESDDVLNGPHGLVSRVRTAQRDGRLNQAEGAALWDAINRKLERLKSGGYAG